MGSGAAGLLNPAGGWGDHGHPRFMKQGMLKEHSAATQVRPAFPFEGAQRAP